MPPHPKPLPDELGPQFSVRDARTAGVSLRRLRHKDLEQPFIGARMRRTDGVLIADSGRSSHAIAADEARSDIRRRARAYATVMPSHAFFFGVTAAVVWDIPLPLRVLRTATSVGGRMPQHARRLDVAVHPPHRAPRARGLTSRQLSPRLTTTREHDGLRLASPATVWAQLATELSVDELIAAGDAIVQPPRRPNGARDAASALADVAQLEAAMTAGRRTGAARLREAVPQVRVGSDSSAETGLRLAIERAGLPDPELDFTVLDARGRVIGFTELAYPRWRLLLEYEGDHHRTDRAQWHRDVEKHAACTDLGWTVLRFTSAHVYPSPRPAIERIRTALRRAGWSG
ncbi:hypothetical protein P0L94_17205 [Microbacter sp. GSS18]|nr:hypothetical protein P0L94_17205 [Microbacter sp. GSS18]